MKKVIFIEGTTMKDNGDLRKAFNLLLSKELKNNMPRIVMGDGKTQTIDKFQTRPLEKDEVRFLLVDSDAPLTDKKRAVAEINDKRPVEQRKVSSNEDNTFFMVQEAEAWIMAQPNVLKAQKINTSSLPKSDMMQIADPSDVLADIYKKSGKEYHKVREFVKLFPALNTQSLKNLFPEFKALVEALQK